MLLLEFYEEMLLDNISNRLKRLNRTENCNTESIVTLYNVHATMLLVTIHTMPYQTKYS